MKTICVQDFLDAAEGEVPIKVLCGEGALGRRINEIAINRPGLALAGFFQYFAFKRIQVCGLAEMSYLKSLSAVEQEKRVRELTKQRIPCLVITRGRRPVKALHAACESANIPILQTPLVTSQFINRATLLMENLAAPTEHLHGTLLDILGIGVLLEGKAGVGKSETALSLIERGHSLVADDLTILQRDGLGTLRGYAGELTRYHMEIRGLGLIHVPSLFGMASVRREKMLDMVVRLYKAGEETDVDRTGLEVESREIMGVEVPWIRLPVAAGRDMAHVVEVAAMNQKLKLLGHDAAKELNERLLKNMSKPKGRLGGQEIRWARKD